MDNIIKNPKRDLNPSIIKRKIVPPEYVRLGIEPIPSKDLNLAEKNRQQDFKIAAAEKRQKDLRIAKLPQQMKVNNVGVPDQSWLKSNNKSDFFDEELSDKPDPNWFSKPASLEETEQDELNATSGPIELENLEIPKTSYFEEVEEVEEVEEIDLEVTDTPISQYCVLVSGVIVAIVATSEEVENVIDHIVFSTEEPFAESSVDDISVFKRIGIKAGISIYE